MRKTLTIFSLTLVLLAALDGAVALTLSWAERTGRLGGLVQYFEYGRSVPGKLARWEAQPDVPGNLYDVAWRSEQIARSKDRFRAEGDGQGPVIRSYGMSFVNNILAQAVAMEPGLVWDDHAGPGASPNFTYALFEDDRENRRAGDIVVLGILSSSVPAMAALSNSTWAFEQPAPFTYPIYLPVGERLERVEPLIKDPNAQRALDDDIVARHAWREQLKTHDLFFAPQTFGVVWADRSPFLRLVRRSLAKGHIDRVKSGIIAGGFPYEDVLKRMIQGFARTARADGQIPVIMLIQTRNPRDPDVLSITEPALLRADIPYLATVEHADPEDPSVFLGDGHYTEAVDRVFADAFLDLLTP